MKHQVSLTVASVLALLLFTFHWAHDVIVGVERGGVDSYLGIVVAAGWLYSLIVLAGRRSGYLINLLLSLFTGLVPILHMRGGGLLARRTLDFGPAFFWTWTLFAIAITGLLAFLLSVHGLVSLRRSEAREPS